MTRVGSQRHRKKNYRDTMNVEQEMTDHIGNKWGYKWLEKKFGKRKRKTFNRLTRKDSCSSNSTQKTESNAVWNLKPE